MENTLRDLIAARGSRTLIVADEAEPVSESVDRMGASNAGCVLVRAGGELVGIMTEQDVVRRVVGDRLDPRSTMVCEVMTEPVLCGTPMMSIGATLRLMSRFRRHHLPVLDGSHVVAVVSMGDLMEALTRELPHSVQVAEQVWAPSDRRRVPGAWTRFDLLKQAR